MKTEVLTEKEALDAIALLRTERDAILKELVRTADWRRVKDFFAQAVVQDALKELEALDRGATKSLCESRG